MLLILFIIGTKNAVKFHKISLAILNNLDHQEIILNSFPPRQNGRHLVDDIFRCIFVDEKFCIMIKFSLEFVPKGPINSHYLNQC